MQEYQAAEVGPQQPDAQEAEGQRPGTRSWS